MPALKERHTDHPCPILEELIVGVFVLFCLFVLGFVFLLLLLLFRFVFSSGKGYMVVRTIGLSPHCFWDCPCWPCFVSMPIIPHWSDYLGRNGIYLFLIDFCPSVYQIDLYKNVPVDTPNVYNWKYFTPFSCTVYRYLLSILSLPSANSQEVFPVHGVLFYLPSHGHGVALNAWVFLCSLENETGVWKTGTNHFLPTKK